MKEGQPFRSSEFSAVKPKATLYHYADDMFYRCLGHLKRDYVHARQEQVEQDLKRDWEQDPAALMATKGTPGRHGKTHRPN